jgi:quercetin dioxygenase-like cupin family protein
VVRPSELSPIGQRKEAIASGTAAPLPELLPQAAIRPLADHRIGARGLSTSTSRIQPGAALPPHRHDCGEAITVLEGCGEVEISSEKVRIERLDCIFLPAGAVHALLNLTTEDLVIHSAYASANPSHELARNDGGGSPAHDYHVRRVRGASGYDLGGGTEFHDLFASRFGAEGICGGWARFNPGASLPCHFHEYDESITIVEGRATCEVEGRRYELSGCDTALVPKGLRHRFLNLSAEPMAMIWVYAGDEPSRTVVDPRRCSRGRV